MKNNIVLRHNVVKLIRRYLEDRHGFIEVLPSLFERASVKFFFFFCIFSVWGLTLFLHLGLLFVVD